MPKRCSKIGPIIVMLVSSALLPLAAAGAAPGLPAVEAALAPQVVPGEATCSLPLPAPSLTAGEAQPALFAPQPLAASCASDCRALYFSCLDDCDRAPFPGCYDFCRFDVLYSCYGSCFGG